MGAHAPVTGFCFLFTAVIHTGANGEAGKILSEEVFLLLSRYYYGSNGERGKKKDGEPSCAVSEYFDGQHRDVIRLLIAFHKALQRGVDAVDQFLCARIFGGRDAV